MDICRVNHDPEMHAYCMHLQSVPAVRLALSTWKVEDCQINQARADASVRISATRIFFRRGAVVAHFPLDVENSTVF